jgi:uncharacterized protein YjbI with pentapeptide repeats
VGIGIAVLLIDLANERRESERLKAQLIREMGSQDNGIALWAVEELRAHRWLFDGSLEGENLYYGVMSVLTVRNPSGANLQGSNLREGNLQRVNLHCADLRGADLSWANLQKANLSRANLEHASMSLVNLQGADLTIANLRDANLYPANLQKTNLRGAKLRGPPILHSIPPISAIPTDEQLALADMLRHAEMHDGSRYDGRFNLPGDLRWAEEEEGRDTRDPVAMADFYGVSLEAYILGQMWAGENLEQVRERGRRLLKEWGFDVEDEDDD